MHGNADGARLVGDRARDRLPDPPRGIGRELVDRLHQADIAFLDQVEELQAAVGVFLGDGRTTTPQAAASQGAQRVPRCSQQMGQKRPQMTTTFRTHFTSTSIPGRLMAKASWSMSLASRTTKLRSPHTALPANAGPALPSPCGRARE